LLQEARLLLIKSLEGDIEVLELDFILYQLKVIFFNGTTLYIRYNEFNEYGYQILFSSKKYDYVRYDNYDDRWNVRTRPHHFHPKKQNPVRDSPMIGDPTHDMPILIRFLKKEAL